MHLKSVQTIFSKELRDILRDRRTLFVMVVLPILLYPLLMIVAGQLTATQLGRMQKRASRVAFVGRRYAGDLASVIDTASLIALRDTTGWHERIVAGDLDAALSVSPGFADSVAQKRIPAVGLYHNSSKEASGLARDRLRKLLDSFRDHVLSQRLAALSADTSLLRPFALQPVNLATAQQRQGDVLGKFLGYLLILMTLMGAFYPAVDLTAGEKERGTLETLLVSPASRAEIVFGKFLTVMVISMLTALLNLLSIGFTTIYLIHVLGRAAAASLPGLAVSPLSLLLSLLLVIPLAVIFSAVCLAIAVGARNYKEGQSLLTPVSFAVFLPAMVSLVPGIEVSPTLALIPITNVSLLIREFMAGNYLWTETLLAFGSTSLLAVASLWWATSQFEQESVLFRHAEDIRWSPFQRRRGPGQSAAPSPAAAFVLIVFELLALAWIGSSAANWSLQRTILVSQAIVIALPLFVLRRGGYDRKAVLALSTPRPAAWSATIVLILGGWLLSIGLASVQNRITPFPSDVLKRFQDLFDELSRMPVYTSLLLVAVVPAVCEETLCRGFLLHSLRPRLGRNGAVILTAVIFGLLHMDPYRLVPTIFLGLLFGWLVVQTGSIYPAMLAHAMNNALSFLVYKYEPWFEQVSWLQAESTLLPWYVAVPALTGLTFGIVWLKRIGGSRAPSDSRFPDRPSGAGG